MTHLSLFDLDHTLLPIDSDYEWARFLTHPREQLDAWHVQFMREVIAPDAHASARALVDAYHARGDLCAVVTANSRFVQ